MLFVENLLGFTDVGIGLGLAVPRQLQYSLNVSPAHVCVRAHHVHLAELVDFLAKLLVYFLIEFKLIQLFKPSPALILSVIICLTELFLDNIELLTQIVLALTLAHVLHHSVVDAFSQRKHLILSAESFYKLLYQVAYRVQLQQSL